MDKTVHKPWVKDNIEFTLRPYDDFRQFVLERNDLRLSVRSRPGSAYKTVDTFLGSLTSSHDVLPCEAHAFQSCIEETVKGTLQKTRL